MFQRAIGKGDAVPKNSAPQIDDRPPSPLVVASIENTRASSPIVAVDLDLNLQIERGGGKGWPTYASFVLYHSARCLLIVGTDLGTIYVYGEGFQFLKSHLGPDGESVASITELNNDQILVSFSDNSLLVLDIPELTVYSSLGSTWLRAGDITSIRHDELSDKRYQLLFVHCVISK
jgi:hypothetical protein